MAVFFNLEGKNAKAYFRLARSQIALEQYSDGIETIQKALQNYNNIDNEAKVDTKNTAHYNKAKQEQAEFQKLLFQIHKKKQSIHKNRETEHERKQPIVTIKSKESPTPSIRDFTKSKTLGDGNFSKVILCIHNTTKEECALKIINKDEAGRLAKRQHPNVYNEIQMERKILCEKLNSESTIHPNIIRCWHSFQDYENLYFLMDFCEGGDLWSRLFHKKKMLGCHFSLIPDYMHQILSGIEHLHAHGIVHRDLKPENILMNSKGNPIIIDLGTAKDLIDTKLNGPEFVGTPDFMTPEAVDGKNSSFEADLWTFGAIIYQMFTGQTPFHSVSPYMTFLRIKRAKMKRKMGIVDDNAWDLIEKLMQRDPNKRLGAGTYKLQQIDGKNKVVKPPNGYHIIRSHAFFEVLDEKSKTPGFEYQTMPTLADLCIRSCADLVYATSQNLNVPDPGDNSSHDVLRLPISQRKRIMHALDRMHLLNNSRVYRRFFRTRQEARLGKMRPASYDYVGLTIEDFPLEEQQQQMDDGINVIVKFVYLMNPLFSGTGIDKEEENLKYLKECVRKINKLRPKVVIVCGSAISHHAKVRKLLTKVNESINVVINDGQYFFSIWLTRGIQALILNMEKFEKNDVNQKLWLDEELEQYEVARNTTFAILDSNPSLLSGSVKRKLTKAKIHCVYGVAGDEIEDSFVEDEYVYVPNKEQKDVSDDSDGESDDDNDDDELRKLSLFAGKRSMHLISIEEQTAEVKSELIDIEC